MVTELSNTELHGKLVSASVNTLVLTKKDVSMSYTSLTMFYCDILKVISTASLWKPKYTRAVVGHADLSLAIGIPISIEPD